MSFMVHCDLEKGYRDEHFQSTLLVEREGGNTKDDCTLLIMLTILDDPLCQCHHLIPLPDEMSLFDVTIAIR